MKHHLLKILNIIKISQQYAFGLESKRFHHIFYQTYFCLFEPDDCIPA